jgi:hypothetical protein
MSNVIPFREQREGTSMAPEATPIEQLRQDVLTAQRALDVALRTELLAQIKVVAQELLAAIHEQENNGFQPGPCAVGSALHHFEEFQQKWFSLSRQHVANVDDEEIPF